MCLSVVSLVKKSMMHERNIYKQPPDFKKLSEKYEEFARHVRISSDGRGHLDFRDPEAVRELTYTLLMEDFNLSLDVPLDRLIPTLSLRLNYIHWIEDLLNATKRNEIGRASQVWGIDIGCGASCIYPLLGAKMNDWNFTATEKDELSFSYATKNININNLGNKIFLKIGNKETILKDTLPENQTYDFCMCNPPFFSDREEASGDICRTERRPMPFSVCTATDNESITEGGEVEFVKKIINESLELKGKIKLYTSMLGKKKSFKALKQYLKNLQIPCISTTTFEQGKTTRWGICWSFQDYSTALLPLLPKQKQNLNTAPFSFIIKQCEVQKIAENVSFETRDQNNFVKFVYIEVAKLLRDLEINFNETSVFDSSGNFQHTLDGDAVKNTWSHQRRQRRKAKKLKSNIEETAQTGRTGELLISELPTNNDNGNLLQSTFLQCNEAGKTRVCAEKEGFLALKVDASNVAMAPADYALKIQGESTEACGTPQACGSSTIVEVPTEQMNNRKRPHDKASESQNTPAPLFKFKLILRSNNDTKSRDTSPVRMDVSCAQGNREGVHQLFMYFRNKFNGIQIHD